MKNTVTPLRGRRVLLVEDNAINRAIARSFFRECERACGVSRHLSKPIDLTALHAALCEVLREN